MRRRAVVLAMIFVVSMGALYGAWLYTKSVAQQRFESDVIKVKQSFFEGAKSLDNSVQAVKSFAEVSKDPNQESFGRFATQSIKMNNAITAVSLYKLINDSERSGFEQALKTLNKGTEILQGGLTSTSKIERRPTADYYLPLYAVDSNAQESSYFGWDLRADPSKQKAVDQAMQTGTDQACDTYLLESGNAAVDIISPVKKTIGDHTGIDSIVETSADLTKILGDEQWREGVEIKLGVTLAGDSIEKDVYRHVDGGAQGKIALDHLYSEISVRKFGQILNLKFTKALTLDRINFGALVLTLFASIILTLLALKLLHTYEKLEDSLRKLQWDNSLMKALSHDLNNPLSVVIGTLSVIKGKPDFPVAHKARLEMAERSARAIQDITEQVRRLKAAESGKQTLKLVPVKMDKVFGDLQLLFEERLNKKSLTLKMESFSQNAVLAEESALTNNVLANVISNAIKFSNAGSSIVIAHRSTDGAELISVRDFGQGIPADLLKKLFSATDATSRAGTSGEGGTGFGMLILSFFVELMGGAVSVTSKTAQDSPDDHGTTITIMLTSAPSNG